MDINSLEEYISLVVDGTVKTGIMRQMDAFRDGFNQVSNLLWTLQNFIVVEICLSCIGSFKRIVILSILSLFF